MSNSASGIQTSSSDPPITSQSMGYNRIIWRFIAVASGCVLAVSLAAFAVLFMLHNPWISTTILANAGGYWLLTIPGTFIVLSLMGFAISATSCIIRHRLKKQSQDKYELPATSDSKSSSSSTSAVKDPEDHIKKKSLSTSPHFKEQPATSSSSTFSQLSPSISLSSSTSEGSEDKTEVPIKDTLVTNPDKNSITEEKESSNREATPKPHSSSSSSTSSEVTNSDIESAKHSHVSLKETMSSKTSSSSSTSYASGTEEKPQSYLDPNDDLTVSKPEQSPSPKSDDFFTENKIDPISRNIKELPLENVILSPNPLTISAPQDKQPSPEIKVSEQNSSSGSLQTEKEDNLSKYPLSSLSSESDDSIEESNHEHEGDENLRSPQQSILKKSSSSSQIEIPKTTKIKLNLQLLQEMTKQEKIEKIKLKYGQFQEIYHPYITVGIKLAKSLVALAYCAQYPINQHKQNFWGKKNGEKSGEEIAAEKSAIAEKLMPTFQKLEESIMGMWQFYVDECRTGEINRAKGDGPQTFTSYPPTPPIREYVPIAEYKEGVTNIFAILEAFFDPKLKKKQSTHKMDLLFKAHIEKYGTEKQKENPSLFLIPIRNQRGSPLVNTLLKPLLKSPLNFVSLIQVLDRIFNLKKYIQEVHLDAQSFGNIMHFLNPLISALQGFLFDATLGSRETSKNVQNTLYNIFKKDGNIRELLLEGFMQTYGQNAKIHELRSIGEVLAVVIDHAEFTSWWVDKIDYIAKEINFEQISLDAEMSE